MNKSDYPKTKTKLNTGVKLETRRKPKKPSRRLYERASSRVAFAAIAMSVCLFAVIVAGPDAAAASSYYRWKDEQGKLVVSDRPPVDQAIEYEVVSQGSSLIRRVAPGEGAVPPEVTPRPGNRFDQVDTQKETQASVQKNPERCARARTNLETLDSSARIRIRDPDTGELRYLTEEEKQQQRERALSVIAAHCE